jgi:DNA-binding response OmpR family regulator
VKPAALAGSVAGTETVLVAEDDDLLRPLACELLRKVGYHVLEARDSAEALKVARSHQGEIHLIVSDVVMPGGGGFDLAKQICAERPTMRVLFMSGYTDEAVVRHGLLERGLNYLQKPFTPAVLARRVRDALDAK